MKLDFAAALALCVALSACASAPPQLEFNRTGASASQKEADSKACWDFALRSPEGRKAADTVNGARLIGGGLIAAANMAAEKSAYNNDQKKDLGNWSAHRDCMAGKGYTSKMAGW